jgi:transposase
MIPMIPGTKVYLACQPVSMRLGFDGLAARVAEMLAGDPFSGHLFLFRSKRADYLKVLYYDGTGLCLFAKRLESGRFVWPPIVDGKMLLTPAQLTLLIEAMDWRRTVAAEAPKTYGRWLRKNADLSNIPDARPCTSNRDSVYCIYVVSDPAAAGRPHCAAQLRGGFAG